MVILSTSDIFDVKVSSLLADYDRETITNLYQPIIGFTALAVYFTFWSEAKNQKVTSMSSHEQLLLRMKMATGEFIDINAGDNKTEFNTQWEAICKLASDLNI